MHLFMHLTDVLSWFFYKLMNIAFISLNPCPSHFDLFFKAFLINAKWQISKSDSSVNFQVKMHSNTLKYLTLRQFNELVEFCYTCYAFSRHFILYINWLCLHFLMLSLWFKPLTHSLVLSSFQGFLF